MKPYYACCYSPQGTKEIVNPHWCKVFHILIFKHPQEVVFDWVQKSHTNASKEIQCESNDLMVFLYIMMANDLMVMKEVSNLCLLDMSTQPLPCILTFVGIFPTMLCHNLSLNNNLVFFLAAHSNKGYKDSTLDCTNLQHIFSQELSWQSPYAYDLEGREWAHIKVHGRRSFRWLASGNHSELLHPHIVETLTRKLQMPCHYS